MNITETKLKGCFIIEPKVFKDNRGYFYESYNETKLFEKIGYKINFIQDNHSYSTYGVLRGLHFQKGKDAQAKLVRVITGSVLDIVVDIRKESPTFGQYFSLELSSKNKKQIFVPKGCAHGFIVLSDSAEFIYKVDNYYAPESEGGILFNDPELGIDWKVEKEKIIVAPKDLEHPLLKDIFL